MSYAKNNLSPGEKMVYRTSQHWILFIESISIILTALLIFYFSTVYIGGEGAVYVNYMAYATLFFGMFKFGHEYIRHHTSEFVVTTERVIIKIGVFQRTSLAMPLSKIESVEVNQTLMGQILDFGTIHITGTGTATSKFELINHPGTFRRKLQLASEMDEEDKEVTEAQTHQEQRQVRRLRRR
ncbi:MAG: PH domain-containing protein [Microscillaceae bacterium]|jgi:uncharacterized membrane protein YdbT with pleckstrin-like domain|nr:PH domain-containing protein [Microscillaceae bacterium]